MTKTPHSLYHLTPLQRTAWHIQDLFSARASLPVIVARDLQRTLRATYPTLPVTNTAPGLLTPRYRYQDQAISSAGYERSTLVDALINRFVDGVWVDYTQGQLFTAPPDGDPVTVSPLKNLDAQECVNRRGPLLLECCQQALIDDWTELSIEARSRFEMLSELLKKTLKKLSVPTLVTDAAQRQMLNDVLQTPDNNLRTGTTRAYLVDQWGEAGSEHLELLRGIVLTGPASTGEHFILFTLSNGIETFTSSNDLAQALRTRLTGLAPEREMQWRLYEPRSNIFDAFALSFLVKQLSDLQWQVELGRRTPYWDGALLSTVHWLVTGDFDSMRLDASPELARLYSAQPAWIKKINREVRGLFSQHLQALGMLFKQANWRFFDDGVPSLLDYTRQKLMAAYPRSSTLEPKDVILTVHTVRGVSAAGGFPVKVICTLLDVALENLASLPGDAIEVSLRNGAAPPQWLTASAVKALVSTVDIGENYPRQVAAALKDSPAQVLWRSRSFIEQLRLELPMLALEFYSRGQWGFSRQGYDTVVAVMQAQAAERYLGSQVIVLRPLAFKTTASATADVVMNMFVIGPRALDTGPVVLYRPMAQAKLMEFASRQALLEAIDQPGALQQQVLAWMSADARATYCGDGFSAPHFNTLDGLALLIDALTSAPAILASEEVQGDYGQHLYKSQVQAILEQADRQSVSNRENLWARRMEGVSLGLNSVMPLVTGPLAVIGWLQVAWTVHQQIVEVNQGDSGDQDSGLVGFFLSMALVLMHYSNDAIGEQANAAGDDDDTQVQRPEVPDEPDTPVLNVQLPAVQLPAMDAARDTGPARSAIEYGWISASSRLTPSQLADLQTFSVPKPAGATQAAGGVTAGLLSREGQWFAEVDDYCFNVSVEGSGVRVVAGNGRRGPWLKSDGKGAWSLDLRLRLLGGAPGQESAAAAQVRALQERYDTHYAQFSTAQMPEARLIVQLNAEVNLSTRLASITREIDSVVLLHQRAKLLSDLLEQRRRAEIVHDYAALRHRFLAAQVQCLRFQIRLMEVRRTALYQQMSDPSNAYLLTFHEVARHLLSSSMREGLRAIARLHGEVVQLCREQRTAYEAMLDSARPGYEQVSALDAPEWRGKAPILAWLEAGLRPMLLRCLKEKAAAPGMEALSILQNAHLRCRLKLSSYRQLFAGPAYSTSEISQVLNETVDELAWQDIQLERAAGIPNDFLDLAALSDYREYLRGLRDEVVRDVLQHNVDLLQGKTSGAVVSGRILQSRHYGSLLPTQSEPSGASSAGRSSADVVAFIDPYTRVAFARFIKAQVHGENDWVYQPVEASQVIQWKPQNYINSWQMIQRADAALGRLPSLERNTLVAPRAVRADAELLAQELLEDLQRSSEARKEAEHSDPLMAALEVNLRNKANALISAARGTQQRMILAREPTTAGVADLLAEGIVEIKEVPDTKRVPGVGTPPLFRSFYIQKAKASHEAPEVLWFAHFHYPSGHTGGPLDFSFAHLKSGTTAVAGFKQRLRMARGNNERLLSIFRTTIEREAAQSLFFSDEVTPAQ